SLWAMGYNGYGELGDGRLTNTNQPEQIVSSGVTAIACGSLHSLFLESDGSLWGMGDNRYGQLGGGGFLKTNLPTKIIGTGGPPRAAATWFSVFVVGDSLWAMGADDYGQLGDGKYASSNGLPQQIVSPGVAAIACGNLHTLFLKSDHSLWAMGDNEKG